MTLTLRELRREKGKEPGALSLGRGLRRVLLQHRLVTHPGRGGETVERREEKVTRQPVVPRAARCACLPPPSAWHPAFDRHRAEAARQALCLMPGAPHLLRRYCFFAGINIVAALVMC